MGLAQGPQRSNAGEARTRSLSVSSQALYHWATALPYLIVNKGLKKLLSVLQLQILFLVFFRFLTPEPASWYLVQEH